MTMIAADENMKGEGCYGTSKMKTNAPLQPFKSCGAF